VADIATLSAKFQITIRKPVREAHDWKPGQTFALVPTGSGVALVPVLEIGAWRESPPARRQRTTATATIAIGAPGRYLGVDRMADQAADRRRSGTFASRP
jgi:bifunctional DNA-binding transcriptional regulator/antitoxin component of YhaV-PrlF toxin-antitoxin module